MMAKDKRPKVVRTKSDIEELFDDQVRFLARSAVAFDSGSTAEYRRMAHSLRMLAHQTKMSHSLLGQMDLLGRHYANSARPIMPENIVPECQLIALEIPDKPDLGPKWRCRLDDATMDFVDFQTWWTRPVMDDRVGEPLSRSAIVLCIADQDGGSHVDPSIDAAFQRLREEGFKWTSGRHISRHPDRFAIRQIAHEMLKSLRPSYRRKPKPLRNASWNGGALLYKVGATPPGEIIGYHLTLPDAPCPCQSGRNYEQCHKLGEARPRDFSRMDVSKYPQRTINFNWNNAIFERKLTIS